MTTNAHNHHGPSDGSRAERWSDDPALLAIDDHLRDTSGGRHLPAGLTDRVFAASVEGLVGHAGERRLRLVPGVGRGMSPAMAWFGRLGMAASVGLAFVLAGSFLKPVPPGESDGGSIAGVTTVDPSASVVVESSSPDISQVATGAATTASRLEDTEEIFALLDSHDRDFTDVEASLSSSAYSYSDFAADMDLISTEMNRFPG